MRKIVIAIALSASASIAFGAMGANLGLPAAWTPNADRGYGTGGMVRNNASAMCVECHQANPSSTVMMLSDGGADAIDRDLQVNGGSHFVINNVAGAAATNSGGGHAGSFGDAARDNGEFLRGGVWDGGGTSKFAVDTFDSMIYETDGAFDPATAGMICESCHSLVYNENNGAGDNDLLLGIYQDNVEDALCSGCHAQNEGSRVAFHANSNIKNFSGASRKFHHVMTGDSIDPVGDYPDDGVSGQRWAPSFTAILGTGWCTTANKFDSTARGTAVNITAATAPAFRDACNIAGSGTRAAGDPVTLGDIVINATTPVISCSSCHRPHNAKTQSGAHIFRSGNLSAGDYAGTFTAPFTNASANIYAGLRRQSDTTGTVYGEYRPLCLGCHVGY